jgi:transcriptional regulator with XRE-family HTH domain
MRAGYSGVIEQAPNPQTKLFADKPINLSALARSANCSASHLSRVFTGKVNPSLQLAKVLALCLSMSVDEFVSNLDGLKDKAA